MSEVYRPSQEDSDSLLMTVDEARRDMQYIIDKHESDPSEAGRFMYERAKNVLESEEALQVFVDTWNSIARQYTEDRSQG